MERRWVRPLLCRLCECPVADGGVPLSRLDRPKLSEWWLKHLDIEFDDEDAEDAWICLFCQWDARFEHENSDRTLETDHVWWPVRSGYDYIYEKYYKDELITPCCIKIEGQRKTTTSNSQNSQQIESSTKRSPKKPKFHKEKLSRLHSKCIYCNTIVKHLWLHIKQKHAESFIRCPLYLCTTFFKTQEEREEHVLKVHATNKCKIHCVYCSVYLPDAKTQWRHMKIHKDVAIRCPYRHCPTYVRSQEEKEVHIEEVLKKGKVKCIFCDFTFVSDSLKQHIRFYHSDVAIKCNYNRNCPSYFKTLEQRDEHIKEKHQVERVKKKITCLICKEKLEQGSNYQNHMRFVHCDVAIKCNNDKCNQYFKSAEQRDEHFREKHDGKGLKCQHCDYKTNNDDCFKQHVSLKHGTDNLPCPECPGKIYKSQLALKRHIYLVHSEKLVCSHCGIALVKSDYRKHLQSDFCAICDQKVFCMGMMNLHKTKCQDVRHDLTRKLLAAKKNYKFHCELCKTSHKTRGRLVVHMKNVHGHSNKFFQCSACKKKFVCRIIRDGHRCRPILVEEPQCS